MLAVNCQQWFARIEQARQGPRPAGLLKPRVPRGSVGHPQWYCQGEILGWRFCQWCTNVQGRRFGLPFSRGRFPAPLENPFFRGVGERALLPDASAAGGVGTAWVRRFGFFRNVGIGIRLWWIVKKRKTKPAGGPTESWKGANGV